MAALRSPHWWAVTAGALLFLAAACGPATPASPRHFRLVRVSLQWPRTSLAALPIYVAEAHGWFRHAGYRLEDRGGGAALTFAGPSGSPLTAVLTTRSDLVLVSPLPEPDFRWRDLTDLPLPSAGLAPGEVDLVDALLREHGVTAVHWEPLPPETAVNLYRRHHLPWLLTSLVDAARWFAPGDSHAMAYVGAAMGPLPVWVVTGPALPVPVLAVLNRALAAIATEPATSLARLTARDYPGVPETRLAAAIQDAQALQLFSPSTLVSPGLYEAGRAFWADAGHPWPPYTSAVQAGNAATALTVWP